MTVAERIKDLRKQAGLTQTELGEKLGVKKNAVSKWECGRVEDIPSSKIKAMAALFGVQPSYLIDDSWGETVTTKASSGETSSVPPGFQPLPRMVKKPLIGSIACGEPILAEQNIEDYVDVPENVHCDFVLHCNGDSMIDAGISDGDQVYIRIQPKVENGEIAAVRIGDEATLKRVYWDGASLMLMPANAKYAPKTYTGEQLDEIQIEGKAVGFTHWF